MSTIAAIDSHHAQCRAIVSSPNPTRSDYRAALRHADAAYTLAEEAGLDPRVLGSCEQYQSYCVDLVRRSLASIERHDHDVYRRASAKLCSMPCPPNPVVFCGGGMVRRLEPQQQQQQQQGPRHCRTVKFHEPLVGMRDVHGNLVPARKVPQLRTKTGQSFEGWRNVL